MGRGRGCREGKTIGQPVYQKAEQERQTFFEYKNATQS